MVIYTHKSAHKYLASPTHLGCLNFVSRTAAPSFEIRQHFALLPVHAGMHLAPPLLCNYRCCGENRGRETVTERNKLEWRQLTTCRLKEHSVSRYFPVIEESVFWSVADTETCQTHLGVFSGLNSRSVSSLSVVSGCLYVGGGNKACSRGRSIKVLRCSEEAYRGETASSPKWREGTVRSEEAPVRAVPVKGGDGDRSACNGGHFWHDIKWPGLLSAPLNTRSDTASRTTENELVGSLIPTISESLWDKTADVKTSTLCFVFLLLLLPQNKPLIAGFVPEINSERHSDSCDSSAARRVSSRNQQNCNEKPGVPSTHDGAALVVPATCPGKQEHLTVWDLSSILFLLQHRCAAITSQVPAFTWTEKQKHRRRLESMSLQQSFTQQWFVWAFSLMYTD